MNFLKDLLAASLLTLWATSIPLIFAVMPLVVIRVPARAFLRSTWECPCVDSEKS